MKLRLYKDQMRRALMWYTNTLASKHLGDLLTPAKIEVIRYDLYNLQTQQQKRENNPVWQVPVDLKIDKQTQSFEVIIADDSNLLYIDFDKP